MSKLIPTKYAYVGDKLKLKVDGHNLAHVVDSITVEHQPGLDPVLTVRLGWPVQVDHDAPTLVQVDAPTASALVAMGWTPPGGSETGGNANVST